jgi:PIN domain nuclease of toxin-antitoxin system
MDASAVLAYLQGEPGAAEFETALAHSCISAVNLAEVLSKLVDAGINLQTACAAVRDLPCEVVPFDRDLAERVAGLRMATRKRGLSLGDRACLALAEREKGTAFTTDRDWLKIGTATDIRVVR